MERYGDLCLYFAHIGTELGIVLSMNKLPIFCLKKKIQSKYINMFSLSRLEFYHIAENSVLALETAAKTTETTA